MRAVVQRCSEARVTVANDVVAQMGPGILVLLGIEEADTQEDVAWLAHKIANLRIFADANGVMNRSVVQCGGEAIVVSQFTLHASTKKGHRPSYMKAAGHKVAVPLYEAFLTALESAMGKKVGCGVFGADMQVALVNDGPVTIVMDTKSKE